MAILDSALLEEKRKAEAALAYRLDFERLVTRLSTRFIQSSARELDDAITWALEQLGDFTHVDRGRSRRCSPSSRCRCQSAKNCTA